MPLFSVTQSIQSIDRLVSDLENAAPNVDITILGVFSNYLAIKSAGLVETTVISILSEYGRTHGNKRLEKFVQKTIERNNSLNCEKIKSILDQFDTSWWPEIVENTTQRSREAIDSLKTLRDQLSHGRDNGTGLNTIKSYYIESKIVLESINNIVLN